ncbi:MAG: hypothetical protein ACP5OV_03075 [Acidimicrobiales bacterium]
MAPAATAPGGGATWAQRPRGVPVAVPAPGVPLSFLGAAALGLIATGVAWLVVAGRAAHDVTADPVVAAVHLGVLATLAMGLFGALHQFVPVITGRPLRSTIAGYASCALWFAASWMLPLGIGLSVPAVTGLGGASAGIAVLVVAWNLWPALRVRGQGPAVTAMRWSMTGALITTYLGVAFVGDRQASWFVLSARVDLAMGVVGMFTWLGTAYVGVASKLWPMFMLAHLESRARSVRASVWLVPTGALVLGAGLITALPAVAGSGALALAAGLAAHLVALGAHVRRRRRARDLHLVFVVTSATSLVGGVALALAAAVTSGAHPRAGRDLAAAAMALGGGWLLLTLVGHAHKVVPFIAWSVLRARGVVSNSHGQTLGFADLYSARGALASYVSTTGGVAALGLGLATGSPPLTRLAGILLAGTGVLVGTNLGLGPWRVAHANRVPATASGPRDSAPIL